MKSKTVAALCAACIATLMGVFQFTPFMFVERAALVLLTTFGGFWVIIRYSGVPRTLRRWIIVFILLGGTSMLANVRFHETSLVSAFIGSLPFFQVLACVPLYFWLRRPLILHKTLKGIYFIGIAACLVVIWMWFFQLSFEFVSIVGDNTLQMDCTKLNKQFINFTGCLFLAKFLAERRYWFFILALTMWAANMLGDFQRGVFLALIVLFSYVLVTHRNQFSVYKGAALLMFMCAILLSNDVFRESVHDKFDQVFATVIDDRKTTDFSVEARGQEVAVGWEGFLQSPIIGNGLFRNSEKERIFGDTYFHVSDIGVIGMLYALGLIGLFTFLSQIRAVSRLIVVGDFEKGLCFYLVFSLALSVLTAKSIITPVTFILPLMLLICSKMTDKMSEKGI